MKILIAGDTTRGKQWERYLRKSVSVTEVVVSSAAQNEKADAIILLDNSASNLDNLLGLIRKGNSVFLVSDLPLQIQQLERIYHTSEESNVSVQFSHWPSFTEMTRWVRKKVQNIPLLIDIQKTFKNRSLPDPMQVKMGWADELAFLLTLQKNHVLNTSVLPIQINNKFAGIHLTLRFNSGAIGSLRYFTIAPSETHQRVIHSRNSICYCNVQENTATNYSTGMDSYSILDSKVLTFDPKTTVHHSIDAFIRSLKTHKPSGFSAADALQTARLVKKINSQMQSF